MAFFPVDLKMLFIAHLVLNFQTRCLSLLTFDSVTVHRPHCSVNVAGLVCPPDCLRNS